VTVIFCAAIGTPIASAKAHVTTAVIRFCIDRLLTRVPPPPLMIGGDGRYDDLTSGDAGGPA
jgi:hypothetical protein